MSTGLLGSGHFVHRIDPVMLEVTGVYLWYYGLTYSLGFLGVFLWLRRARRRLDLASSDVYDLSILVALGILVIGRLFEVVFYEWAYYRRHPLQIASYWQGGMSTHGILLGASVGAWLFCRWRHRSFLAVADELAIPGAFIMAVGRLGNFIDGQIVGSPTGVWWAVRFPDAAGFRHPVVLYDALKNLLIIPILLLVRRSGPPRPGRLLGHFVLWYGFLRLFVDHFREYPVRILGVGTGQYFNLAMAAAGLALLGWLSCRAPHIPSSGARRADPPPAASAGRGHPLLARRAALAALLAAPLVIPSDWTQDVPRRYGKRHPMRYSVLYRPLDS